MNNHRLLTGLLAAVLCSGGVCGHALSTVVYTLDEIFAAAEKGSVLLRPSLTAETASAIELDAARRSRLPEINASVSVGYNGDGFTTDRHFSDYQKAPIPHFNNVAAVEIMQPVYAGGAISGAIEMASHKSIAARFATDMARDDIRFRLTGFYLDIYKYRNLRGVMEKNITLATRVLDDMKARHAEGMALRNDITRYELLLSNMELELTRIDNTLVILNSNLVSMAGLPEGTTVLPDSTLLARSLGMEGEATWQEVARDNAPSLKLASTAVDMSRTGEKLAKSELMPHVGIQAGWNFNGPILVEVPPINRNLGYWYVGVGVNYSLSSLYKSNRKVAAAKARTLEAYDNLSASRLNVELGVRADYIRYCEAYEELRTQEHSVELADRNYATTSTRFAEGMALITDQLDAANSKLDAEQRLVNARINIIYYYYKLLFTSGQI